MNPLILVAIESRVQWPRNELSIRWLRVRVPSSSLRTGPSAALFRPQEHCQARDRGLSPPNCPVAPAEAGDGAGAVAGGAPCSPGWSPAGYGARWRPARAREALLG